VAATYCAGCGTEVVTRADFAVTGWDLRDGRCPTCGHAMAGVGLQSAPGIG